MLKQETRSCVWVLQHLWKHNSDHAQLPVLDTVFLDPGFSSGFKW